MISIKNSDRVQIYMISSVQKYMISINLGLCSTIHMKITVMMFKIAVNCVQWMINELHHLVISIYHSLNIINHIFEMLNHPNCCSILLSRVVSK